MILPICDVTRIELELTSTCNLECPLCLRQTHPETKIKIKHRTKDDIINQVKSYNNLKYITIAGPTSEPTLHPELFEIIKELIKLDLEISLYINGDTHNDDYYRKLGLIFKSAKGHIYFTVCGSTQELHSKYRVNSKLDDVVRRFKIVDKWSKKGILTWLVFNYNIDDFNENYKMFKDYETEYFYTLPIQEHFNIDSDIHLPEPQHSVYNNINRNAIDYDCPAKKFGFHLISCDGEVNPCSLYKIYGTDRCFECSKNNAEFLREHKIMHVAEPEDDISEIEMRI